MKHFSINQFSCQYWCGMPNVVKENLEALVVNILDPVYEKFSKLLGFDELPEERRKSPIKINAGYICRKHLAELGLSNRLQFDKGEAADISAESMYYQNMKEWREANRMLAGLVVKNGKFDQLIIYPTFVHVSYKKNGGNRKQVIDKS